MDNNRWTAKVNNNIFNITSIEANILPLINEYVNHENEMNNYSEENNELKLDENKKIILERLILEYDDTTKNVSYYNMSGYLLEK